MITEYLPYWALVLLFLTQIFVLGKILYENREPSETTFWFIIIFALPLLGLIIFLIFGRDWRKGTRKTRAEMKLSQSVMNKFMSGYYKNYSNYEAKFLRAHANDWFSKLAISNQQNDLAPVMPANEVKILPHGSVGFDALKEDIRNAKKSVHMTFFIWEYDELTAELTELLMDCLARKVEVRIKYDFMGSLAYKKIELKKLKKAGAQVVSDIVDLTRMNYRNHRKIAIIDNVIGYTGGVNIGQEYIDGGKNYPAWRDTFVRVTGPIVAELQRSFAARWIINTQENLFKKKYFPVHPVSKNAVPTQLNHSSSDYEWSCARNAFLTMIMSAKKSVVIQSPYFIPDQALSAAIETATLSGVEVKLLFTGWPDKKFVWWAAHTFFEKLLKSGMRIYFWEPGFMHAKTITIDDEFVTIGSTNFDARSFNLQKEVTLFIYDKAVTKEHLKVLKNDFSKCKEFTLADYKKLTWSEKLRNSICKLPSSLF